LKKFRILSKLSKITMLSFSNDILSFISLYKNFSGRTKIWKCIKVCNGKTICII